LVRFAEVVKEEPETPDTETIGESVVGETRKVCCAEEPPTSTVDVNVLLVHVVPAAHGTAATTRVPGAIMTPGVGMFLMWVPGKAVINTGIATGFEPELQESVTVVSRSFCVYASRKVVVVGKLI
jgi:hypothetical protein